MAFLCSASTRKHSTRAYAAGLMSPSAVGYITPRILLPLALNVTSVQEEILRAHERAHAHVAVGARARVGVEVGVKVRVKVRVGVIVTVRVRVRVGVRVRVRG